MTLDDLARLLIASPTAGAAEGALAALVGLARDGDDAASDSLCRALAAALGAQAPAAGGEWPSPWLAAYALARRPREFLAAAAGLDERTRTSASWQPGFTALQRLVRTRHPLQHEALKACVLAVLAGMVGMQQHMGALTAGSMLPVLDRVLDGAQVVEGNDSDSTLKFGRERILATARAEAFEFVVAHELGHNVFDVLHGRGARAGDRTGGVEDDPHAAALADLAAAWPALLHTACERRGQPLNGDPERSHVAPDGVRVAVTHEQRPLGAYFHVSMSHAGGPIDVALGARVAHALLAWTGADADQAALAWSARGLLHLGFRGDERNIPAAPLPQAAVAAAIDRSRAQALPWLEALRAAQRFGRSEGDVPRALGVVPRRPVFHGHPAASADLHALRWAGEHGLLDGTRPVSLDDAQARALTVAAWRGAAPALLERLLHDRSADAATLRAQPWPLGDVGSSVGALLEGDVTTPIGPTAEDILETLRVVHDAGLSLDVSADAAGRSLLQRAATLDAALVRALLASGADPAHAGAEGTTPLHAAALADRADAAAALLEAGAPVDAVDRDGRTPLSHAASAAMVDALVGAGADVDHAAADGTTATMQAAARGDAGALRALLDAGADVDAPDGLGATALHHAVLAPAAAQCVAMLLAAGAGAEEETHAGETPVARAVRHGRDDIVRLLSARGAPVPAGDDRVQGGPR